MASAEARLTVVVPIHNTGRYLTKCLDSLVRQSLPQVEFLCIDDGSTDDSLSILRSYAKYDPRFSVVAQENRGVGATRNRGIEEAKGSYIAFLDADDYLPNPSTLQHLWDGAERHGVSICGGSFSEDHGHRIRTTFDGIYKKYTFAADGLMDYREYQFDYGYHRFIYSAELLRRHEISFPEYIRFQDPPFFVRAMAYAQTFYALAEPTYCYRWGHQELDWNHRRTFDVVRGLRDNLEIAAEFELSELQRLTWYRLTEEYRGRIVARLGAGDQVIREALLDCQHLAPDAESGEQVDAMLAQGRRLEASPAGQPPRSAIRVKPMESNHKVDPRIRGLSSDTKIVYHPATETVTSRVLRRLVTAEYELVQVRDLADFSGRTEEAKSRDADTLFVSDVPVPGANVLETKDFLSQFLLTRQDTATPPRDLPGKVSVRPDETYFSFGEAYPDKVLYLCGPLGWNSGFFAEYLYALSQIEYANKNGFTPIVDWQTSRSNFAASPEDFWRRNPFNYFFDDVSGFSVDDALQAKHVVVCRSRRPVAVSVGRIFTDNDYRAAIRTKFRHYLVPSPGLRAMVEMVQDAYYPNDGRKVLGIQARGMEFRMTSKASKLFSGHQIQPSIDQVITKANEFLAMYDIGKILFASEDEEYCRRMTQAFGDRAVILPLSRYRFDPKITIDELLTRYPAKETAENVASAYRYIASMTVLARSDYFIGGKNSGSVYVATKGDFEDIFTFDLGLTGSEA